MPLLSRVRESLREGGLGRTLKVGLRWIWLRTTAPVRRRLMIRRARKRKRVKAPSLGHWLRSYGPLQPHDAPRTPLTLVVRVGPHTTVREVEETVRSITKQTHEAWSLLFHAPDGAHDAVAAVMRRWAGRHDAISTVEGTGTVLGVVGGEYLAVVEAGDRLAPTALEWCASCTTRADIVYTDGAWADAMGRVQAFDFKPAWSPLMLVGTDYLDMLTFLRTERLRAMSGGDDFLDPRLRLGVLLRLAEQGPEVAHLPNVLLTRRTRPVAPDPDAENRGITAVQEAVERRGWEASAGLGTGRPFDYRVRWHQAAEPPVVKVVIPTRDRVDLLREAVGGVLYRTDHPAIHLVVVDNGSRDPETLWYLEALRSDHDEVSVVRHDDAFNYSELVNLGADTGPETPYTVLLNNDVVIRHREWLTQLIGWFQVPEVVAVGTKLLFPDGRIQHAGVVVGFGGVAGHYGLGEDDQPKVGRYHDQAREVGCVTAACMAVRTEAYRKVGGLDETLPVDFQDVDFCLRLGHDLGGTIVYDPTYPLLHAQGSTRGSTGASSAYTVSRLRFRWQEVLDAGDPYYSPHLPQTPMARDEFDAGIDVIPESEEERRRRLEPRWSS